MSTKALERLQDHPTPWWSAYALRHPTVVRRTVEAYASDRFDTVLIACGLAAFAMTLVLALAWFTAIDARFRAALPHMWIMATFITLVVMPPAYGIVFNHLRSTYKIVMAGVHGRHPGAFLAVAEAWEREHEIVVLRAMAEAVAPRARLPARPRQRL